MSRFHRHLSIAVLLSEFSHVFCCVLPTVFTVLSFAANLGMITVLPGFILDWHEHLHAYEVPIIVVSGLMLLVGWLAHLSSRQVDCHDHGCAHPPCDTRKTTNSKILVVASILFAMNLLIYAFVHKNVLHLAYFAPATVQSAADPGHGHAH